MRIAKSSYFKERLVGCAGDSRGAWKVIRDVLGQNKTKNSSIKLKIDDNILSDSSDIASAFNEYFINVGSSLSSNIIDTGIPPETFFNNRCQTELLFNPISEGELFDVVQDLSDASAGCDDVPPKILKQVIDEIKTPLIHILNLSLLNGIFPETLKKSKTVPIFKSGSKSELNNYRPISIQSVFSKILEKIVYIQLDNFINTNSIVIDNQFGFQKHKSTTSAIITLTDYILHAFDDKKFVIGIFLDFKKAFDTVNHPILLKKLDHIGIRGVTLEWFRSYLENRTQYTIFNNHKSSTQTLNYSIPQGTILGPTLFNLYINDLINSLTRLNLILFADDSCLYLAHNDINYLVNIVNSELINVNRWMNSNKLTLNHTKSHYVIFKRNKNLNQETQIQINGHDVEKVNFTKFLVVKLQSNLKWNTHIKDISCKLNKYSSIFYQIRNNLGSKHLLLLYNSIVYPQLTYCNIIWGKTFKSHLNQLFISQKRIIRTIMYRNKYHHTNQDFYDLKILKLSDINTYFGIIFVFKSINNLTCPANHFVPSQYIQHNLRNSSPLTPRYFSSAQGQTSPSYYCAIIWNKLPPYIRLKPSVGSLKSALKNHLLCQYNI